MRRRMISLLLVICLSVLLYIPTPAQASTVSDDDIINAVLVVFNYREGTYNSVNRNDNGSLSIGKLQWHGQRALSLMKDVVAADQATARQLLGEGLYQEIVMAPQGAWNSRVLNQNEASAFSALLATNASVRVQDDLARRDVSSYISHGRTAGIRTAAAMVYYCDLENQYGSGNAGNLVSRIKARLGKVTIDSLDELHYTLLQVTTNYHSRRQWVYNYCSSVNWNEVDWNGGVHFTAPQIPADLDVQPPTISRADVTCLSADTFRVTIEASDDTRVSDCRVEVGTKVETKDIWAGYAGLSGKIWSLDVSAGGAYAAVQRFYITVTVSDPFGNGTSTKLEVTRKELTEAQGQVEDPCVRDGHSYAFLYDMEATCLTPEIRVEQCSGCFDVRRLQLSQAKGHRFLITGVPADCTHEGYIQYTCKDCDAQTRIPTSPATAHTWSDWRTNKSGGMIERNCTECGTVQPRTAAP